MFKRLLCEAQYVCYLTHLEAGSKEAIYWRYQAATNGHGRAQYEMACSLSKVIHKRRQNRNAKAAFGWFLKSVASDSKNNLALFDLAECYDYGRGTVVDYYKACLHYHTYIKLFPDKIQEISGYCLQASERRLWELACILRTKMPTFGEAGEFPGLTFSIPGSDRLSKTSVLGEYRGMCLHEDGTRLIISGGRQIVGYDVSLMTPQRYAKILTQDFIHDIQPDPWQSDRFWMGTPNGLYEWDMQAREPTMKKEIFGPFSTCFTYDSCNNCWITGDGNGFDIGHRIFLPMLFTKVCCLICPPKLEGLVLAADRFNHCIWGLNVRTQFVFKLIDAAELKGTAGLAYDAPTGDLLC